MYYWQNEEFWIKNKATPRQMIEWFQTRILSHSLLYYKLHTRLITERELLAMSYTLAHLQIKNMDDAIQSLYFSCFYDWMLGDWQLETICSRVESDKKNLLRIKEKLVSELKLAIAICQDNTTDDEWGIRLVQNSRLAEAGTYFYERQNLKKWKEIVDHDKINDI